MPTSTRMIATFGPAWMLLSAHRNHLGPRRKSIFLDDLTSGAIAPEPGRGGGLVTQSHRVDCMKGLPIYCQSPDQEEIAGAMKVQEDLERGIGLDMHR
jgi:hypothetical protein